MKKLLLSLLILAVASVSHSQKRELILRKAEGQFYLEHKVVAKENYYSIGRLYNVSVKNLAQFNKLDMNKGLNIDQKIKIPLTDTNFTMSGNSGVLVYYKAGLNTTLTRISEAYRNVPVEKLRYWNQRTSEDVAEGEKLIIGFLLTSAMPVVTLDHPPLERVVEVATEEPARTEPVTASHIEEKKEPEQTEEPKVVKDQEKEESAVNNEPAFGYFRQSFEQQVMTKPAKKNKTVTAGIFKTTSGWSDAKYYILIDEIEPGTIVRVINPTNNHVVYAKVLGEMSSIRMNEDLDIRISNAAASVLQVTETDKFILKVNY